MNKTEHYQLNQWQRHDRVLMDDFNADNAKIDVALNSHDTQLAAQANGLLHKGNCQIYTATYVGTGESGTSNPNTLTFPQKPSLVIVGYNNSFMLHIFPCDTSISWDHNFCEFKWVGNTLSWYSTNPTYQLNVKGTTYYVTAFYATD